MQLTEEEVAADDGDVDYFLLFVGTTQRHLTSTLRSNHDTLQALCPGKPTHSFTAMQTIVFNPAKLHAKHLHEDLSVKRENQEDVLLGLASSLGFHIFRPDLQRARFQKQHVATLQT